MWTLHNGYGSILVAIYILGRPLLGTKHLQPICEACTTRKPSLAWNTCWIIGRTKVLCILTCKFNIRELHVCNSCKAGKAYKYYIKLYQYVWAVGIWNQAFKHHTIQVSIQNQVINGFLSITWPNQFTFTLILYVSTDIVYVLRFLQMEK